MAAITPEKVGSITLNINRDVDNVYSVELKCSVCGMTDHDFIGQFEELDDLEIVGEVVTRTVIDKLVEKHESCFNKRKRN